MENNVKLKDLYFSFFKIGLFTFGGGIAMLPMLEKELVNKHKWCTYEELMDYYAVGQCTPGIIAVNTATFVGYKKGGMCGGIIATMGIVSPSIIIITLIAMFIRSFAELSIVKKAIKGIGVGVCAIIIPSIIKLAKNSIKSIFQLVVACLAFLLIAFSNIPVFLLVVLGAVAGIFYGLLKVKNDLS